VNISLPTDPAPPSWRALWRGLTRRCPRCGSGGLFRRWFTMVDACPRCGLHFEREEGYWVGAMMVNISVTEAVFIVLFVGLLVLTWPDVPWSGVMVAVVGANLLIPIVFYPFSKTLWVAMERIVRRWAD
jgi:uncharacterized protein (DUF983 family)